MRTEVQLSTPEAHRLIEGRGGEKGRGVIIGLTGFARQARIAQQAFAADDPFAAWWLMSRDHMREEASEALAAETSRIRILLDTLPPQLVPAEDGNQPGIALTLTPYAYRALLCLIEYDDLVLMGRQAEGYGLISRQDLRDLVYRNGRRIRGLFASAAEYRRTGCTTEDLRTGSQVARDAVEVLVKSGFIRIGLFNDFDDICGEFAGAVSQLKNSPDIGPLVGVS